MRTYFILLLMFISFDGQAQENFCSTSSILGHDIDNEIFRSTDPDTCRFYYVKIRPIFVRRSNGTGGQLIDYNSSLPQIISDYLNHKIRIYSLAPIFIDNDLLYNQIVPPHQIYEEVYVDSLMAYLDRNNVNYFGAINIFIGNPDITDIRGMAFNIVSDKILIRGSSIVSGLPFLGRTISHEIGHCLGLYHTFERDMTCLECPGSNEPNCSDCGDKVCDTEADPYGINFGDSLNPIIITRYNVNSNCDFSPNNLQNISCASNINYNPDTRNIMSNYTHCFQHFTPGQARRMKFLFSYQPHILMDDEDIIVHENTVWDYDIVLPDGDIIIEPGITLTVLAKVQLTKDTKIVIKQGAQLILNGGTLTMKAGYGLCQENIGMWEGIQLLGASNLPQIPANQGKLLIYNGGTIEYAKTALRLVTTVNNHPYGGGIISANNAIFRNNGLAVSMGSYEYAPNISSFTNCTFEINNDYYTSGVTPSGFVNIWRNRDVKFRGCDFSNDAWEQSFSQNLYGIQSYDAAFSVDFHCDGSNTYPCASSFHDSSTFENLRYGIKANKISSAYTYSVANSKFIQNYRGILNSGVDQPAILRNNFSFGINQNSDHMVGISIISGTGYRVEENVFLGKASANSETVGIWVDGTGTADNEVYKNTFYNIGYANLSNGINRRSDGLTGLRFRCNDMNSAVHDISVVKTLSASGIPTLQIGATGTNFSGTPSAGNKFSLIGQPESDFFNNSDYEVDYYFNSFGSREEPQEVTLNKVFRIDGLVNSCNSKISNGGIIEEHLLLGETELSQLADDYNQHEAAYTTLLHNYNSLIDGGNTPLLLQLVYETWPSEAWQLRQELLNQSPYLSVDVLLETAAADILPKAMLLEIILANPDVSTDPALMELLLSLNPSVPGYMLELIEASWGQETPRTVLEASIGAQTSAMQNIISRLLHHYAIDSVDQSENIISWLERAIDLPSKFQLAVYQAEQGELEEAEALLANLGEQNFMLTADELLQKEMLEAYILAIAETAADAHNFSGIESTLLDNLEAYLNNYGDERSYALTLIENLMCLTRERCNVLVPHLPGGGSQFRKSGKNINAPQNVSLVGLRVYPNPASVYTTVEYILPAEENQALVSLYNLQGVCVAKILQRGNRAAVIINIGEFSSGMYFIQLENEQGTVLGRNKLVIK